VHGAARYVCVGCAHRHGVVVKLVAPVVRERRVVRRGMSLELSVRVHGLWHPRAWCSLLLGSALVCVFERVECCLRQQGLHESSPDDKKRAATQGLEPATAPRSGLSLGALD
jgi:hypothetical protein